jgi:methionine-rich copper-binding protein CopC
MKNIEVTGVANEDGSTNYTFENRDRHTVFITPNAAADNYDVNVSVVSDDAEE